VLHFTHCREKPIDSNIYGLSRKHPDAHKLLYEDRDLQCRQCGIRYVRSAEGKAKMDAHLDFHFRQNRRAKDKARKAISRDWYLDEEDWVKEKDADNEPKGTIRC
jgi:pre-mRNA cleavage complex 2 protein Pcf11